MSHLKTVCAFARIYLGRCCWGRLLAGALAGAVFCLANCHADDLVIGNFRGTNYGDWKMTGPAFRARPASGGLLARLEIENAADAAVASSEIDGGGPVLVVLTSKTIESGTRPASVAGQLKPVEILMDRASIEAFVNGGEISSTRFVLPKENGLAVKAVGGSIIIHSLTVQPLKSAWTDRK